MKTVSIDQELESLKTLLHALQPLDESQRRFVLKTASERMGIAPPHAKDAGTTQYSSVSGAPADTRLHPAGLQRTSMGNRNSLEDVTPKQFLKMKRPKTDVERIACLAYYLLNARNQPHFKTDDLTKLNTEAG